jgi:amidohydrolase
LAVLTGGGDGGDTVAMRADMDALPIQDYKKTEYASNVPGVMHACGHDVHTAILMGTAIVLSGVSRGVAGGLPGSVKFIFQPSEEVPVGGARFMIDAGVLEDPAPSAVFALHCYPEMEVGTIGHRAGLVTAAADRLKIIVKGKSGHASRPHRSVDAVLVSSMVINAIHHIVSRRTDPFHPAVISIGTIKGGAVANVIADRVEMSGTVRTLSLEMRENIPKLIEEVVKGVTMTMGAGYDFSYEPGNPSVVNDWALDHLVKKCATDIVSAQGVVEMSEPVLGAEDFAFYTEKVPGAFVRLGTGNARKGVTAQLHSSLFDVDERSLAVGTRFMSWLAASYLDSKARSRG